MLKAILNYQKAYDALLNSDSTPDGDWPEENAFDHAQAHLIAVCDAMERDDECEKLWLEYTTRAEDGSVGEDDEEIDYDLLESSPEDSFSFQQCSREELIQAARKLQAALDVHCSQIRVQESARRELITARAEFLCRSLAFNREARG